MSTGKLAWQGTVFAVQPRIRLTRSFDQRSHSYLGYALRLQGHIDGQEGEFLVGIGKATQAKHQFRVGDIVSGRSAPVADPRLEPVDYYKTAGLKLVQREDSDDHTPPPWHGAPPELEEYRWRGHRRLSARTYAAKCADCTWGCRMTANKLAWEMIVDHWNPWQKRYRMETFCYGTKSCPLYKAGPTRKVPGIVRLLCDNPSWFAEYRDAGRARSAQRGAVVRNRVGARTKSGLKSTGPPCHFAPCHYIHLPSGQ